MSDLNKIILHPNFYKTIEALKQNDIFLPKQSVVDQPSFIINQEGDKKLTNIENIQSFNLNAQNGGSAAKKYAYCAYDESIQKYLALEGTAYFIAHCLAVVAEKDYIPASLVTFNFYTRSKAITDRSPYIKYAEDPAVESDRDYMRDKVAFLMNNAPAKSILFVDGALIGGNLYTIMLDANEAFLEKEIVPVFLVKNSNTSMVTDRIERLRGQYNSDLHWLHAVLKPGQRSNFFKYEDQVNKKNAMMFCYIKAFQASPIRVEIHPSTYFTYQSAITEMLDLIYYLLLVQGATPNPQLRPIAIAEKYARTILRYVDVNKYLKIARISPTINEIRFGG